MFHPTTAAVWAAILLIARPATAISSFRIDEEHNSLSKTPLFRSSRRSVHAAQVRPHDENLDSRNAFNLMSCSLSDRLDTLINDDDDDVVVNDFRERLLQEEQRQATEMMPQHNQFSWAATAGTAAVIVLVASAFISSGSAVVLWKDLTQSSVSIWSVLWIPALWIRPQHFVQDLANYFQLFARGDLLTHFQKNVLPFTGSTLKKMIVAELWARFWKIAFGHVNKLFAAPTSSSSSKSKNNPKIPTWLRRGHSFFKTCIQKGVQKIIRVSMQPHLQATVMWVGALVYTAIQSHVSPWEPPTPDSRHDE